MSDLCFLEKLLDGADLAWLPLKRVASIGTGSSNRQDESEAGSYPFYVRSKNVLKSDTFQFDETAVIVPGEGGIGEIFHFATGKYALHQRAYRISPTAGFLHPKYLFYWMLQNFKSYIVRKSVGSTADSIRKPMLEGFEIPIPCPDEPGKSLAIQREIVRVLDTFTELTAELTAELAARKKQYNHYRDQLLTFEDGEVEWMLLGDLTRIKTGQSVNKNMIADNPGPYPVINSGRDPLGFLDDWNTEDDPIGITSRGAGVGSVTWQKGRYFRGNLNYSVTIKSEDDLNLHYLYHILEQFQPKIKELCTFDGIPALNAVNLKKLSIPVPALSRQASIATILDKFDTLTTSLSEGLPREIALRQQQYEYYRDLLLSFPKPEEAVEV